MSQGHCEIFENYDSAADQHANRQSFSSSFSFRTNFSSMYSILFSVFVSSHLAVVAAHRQQGDWAVRVAPITDSRHVSIPHDRHGGQRLARGVWMWYSVTGSG